MEETHHVLSKLFELTANHLGSNSNDPERPVVRYLPPESLKEQLDLSIAPDGSSYDAILNDIENYLKFSVDTSHRQFINQLYGGMNFPAFLGEVVTALANSSMYTYEVAPVASLIEMELIEKVQKLIGYQNGDGTFLTGGSNANLIAMFSARNKVLPQIKTAGLYDCKPLVAFVSDQSHYSLDTAANLLGIGSHQVRKIPTDHNGSMRVDKLEAAIEESIDSDALPFFIGATAGTTLLGAFDPIQEIVAVAKKHAIWVHVDGALGGPFILSPKHDHLLKGLDQSDSFTMDPHKLMNIPLICSMLLVKEKGRLMGNLTDLDTKYLYHDNEGKYVDRGKASIQCGRRVDVLKLWLAWRFFGDNGYAAHMEKLMDLARYAKERVVSSDRLELLAEPQSVAVCFRYRNRNGADIHEFNLQLRENLRRSGKTLVNYGHWKGGIALRYVATNSDAEKADLDRFFKNLFNMAERLEEA